MATINFSMNLAALGGFNVSDDNHFDAEAVDKIEVTIPHGSTPKNVDVQPGPIGDIKAIKITSDIYVDLTYKVDSGNKVIPLDGPLMLVGTGAIQKFFGSTLNALVFTNTGNLAADDAHVIIRVARTASV